MLKYRTIFSPWQLFHPAPRMIHTQPAAYACGSLRQHMTHHCDSPLQKPSSTRNTDARVAAPGAKNVVLASPYKHLGGMTTGGIMHADAGNESTIYGITREFFERVTPSPRPLQYGCHVDRCMVVEQQGGGSSGDPSCGGDCTPLAATEWLAVSFLSKLSENNKTLTITLPKGQGTSFIKKGELSSSTMPASMSQRVTEGQVFTLTRPVENPSKPP